LLSAEFMITCFHVLMSLGVTGCFKCRFRTSTETEANVSDDIVSCVCVVWVYKSEKEKEAERGW